MTDNEAWRLERAYPVLTIDSTAPIVDNDKREQPTLFDFVEEAQKDGA